MYGDYFPPAVFARATRPQRAVTIEYSLQVHSAAGRWSLEDDGYLAARVHAFHSGDGFAVEDGWIYCQTGRSWPRFGRPVWQADAWKPRLRQVVDSPDTDTHENRAGVRVPSEAADQRGVAAVDGGQSPLPALLRPELPLGG
jgi:hypothetical protein